MFEKIKKDLDGKLKCANALIETCRQAKILSDRAINAMHGGRLKEARTLLDNARKKTKTARKMLKSYPELYATNMQINLAFQEYAEAEILTSLLGKGSLPELDVPAECYLTGLADCVGELNRAFLHSLIRNDKTRAERLMKNAIEINEMLRSFDYPDFVALNLRRKKDMVRAMVNNMLSSMAKSGVRTE